MNKHRSLGIYAFRTPTNDHLWYGTKFRTMHNQGRGGQIADMMRTSDTIATAGGCSYDVEHYLEWSSKIYDQKICARWEDNYWLQKSFDYINTQTVRELERHYDLLIENIERFREQFIPIRWTTATITEGDLKTALKDIIDEYCPAGIAVKNVALGMSGSRTVLYARKTFLQGFPAGQSMLNYYTMAKKFNEVYHI